MATPPASLHSPSVVYCQSHPTASRSPRSDTFSLLFSFSLAYVTPLRLSSRAVHFTVQSFNLQRTSDVMLATSGIGLGTWTPTQRFTYRLPALPSPGNRDPRRLFRLLSSCEVFASCAVALESLQQVARTGGGSRWLATMYLLHSQQVDKLPPSSKHDRNPDFALAGFKS